MKYFKLLFLSIIVIILVGSCSSDDISTININNTYWESTKEASNEYIYALSISNGYLHKLYKNSTETVFTEEFYGKYRIVGNKLIVERKYSNNYSEEIIGLYDNGIIKFGDIAYYLK